MSHPPSQAFRWMSNVGSWTLDVRLLSVLLCALAIPLQAQQPATPPAATQPSQADLEKAFADRLTGAVMSGQYTVGKAGPKSDKYTIVSVRKLTGDSWL